MPAGTVPAARELSDDEQGEQSCADPDEDFDPARHAQHLRDSLSLSSHRVSYLGWTWRIVVAVPRLWTDTIEAHRRDVRDAILDATAALVVERGLLSVTMSEIASSTGIGRATLYKYFPDVASVLVAWHERHVAAHLEELASICDRAGPPGERLAAMLESYAFISQQHHGSEVALLLHRGDHVSNAHQQVTTLVRDIVREGADFGVFRTDVAADELAAYCVHAMAAAAQLRSKAAVRRLVSVTIAGLRPSV